MEEWQSKRIERIAERIKLKARPNALSISFDEISKYVREEDPLSDISRRSPSSFMPHNATAFQSATDEEIQNAINLLCQLSFFARADSQPKSRFKWFKYRFVRDPITKVAAAPTVARTVADKFQEKYRRKGNGTCQRCGGPMIGKGRHAKSQRGHTREICDIQLVKEILES